MRPGQDVATKDPSRRRVVLLTTSVCLGRTVIRRSNTVNRRRNQACRAAPPHEALLLSPRKHVRVCTYNTAVHATRAEQKQVKHVTGTYTTPGSWSTADTACYSMLQQYLWHISSSRFPSEYERINILRSRPPRRICSAYRPTSRPFSGRKCRREN